MTTFIYPEDSCHANHPDEYFYDEHQAVLAAGFKTYLSSGDRYRTYYTGVDRGMFLYRGWMKTPGEYHLMAKDVEHGGGRMITSPDAYRLCHHLPNWYPILADLTAPTIIINDGIDIENALDGVDWPSYFIKDFVKSNNDQLGSLVYDKKDIAKVVGKIKLYRDGIEGGVCIRRGEKYIPDSEKRYFVFNATPHKGGVFIYSNEGLIVFHPLVNQVAERINSPFFSVDIATREDGVERVIEVGDGQVSGRKEIPLDVMIQMFQRGLQ